MASAAEYSRQESHNRGPRTMIGVIADSTERQVVCEFFELFKTPWEWFQEGQQYDVVLCAGDAQRVCRAKLGIVYAGRRISTDDRTVTTYRGSRPRSIEFNGWRIPLYGESAEFVGDNCFLPDETSRTWLAYSELRDGCVTIRVGYDIFAEIKKLLTSGQPAAHSRTAALELHIALLRGLITEQGIRLIEIPPVPDGYRFIACLTHDVDHPSIRRHRLDHTTFGFLYRALFGSLVRFATGRLKIRELLKNWIAAAKLPFVYARIAEDFWCDFGDRYLELEKDVRSTYFFIPFAGVPGEKCPGRDERGAAPSFRSSRYGAADCEDIIRKLKKADCEIGLHGIDAWCDTERGSKELQEIRRLTRDADIGVRMHWLYYDAGSPVTLEDAGILYDSTIGYNETIGYRAGTTQIYKPLGVSHLRELPLHAMDTALFYRAYMNLSPQQARERLIQMADNAAKFGGCLTVNWHDRSLASERLWESTYRYLLDDLKKRGAWFATAGEAVKWFEKRRSVLFQTDDKGSRAETRSADRDNLPGLRLRVHNVPGKSKNGASDAEGYYDFPLSETIQTSDLHGVSR
jgi:hypothetical protein